MAKGNKTIFVCQECGYESVKWAGRCACGAWNSFIEEKVIPIKKDDGRRRTSSDTLRGNVNRLKNISANNREERLDTQIKELNRVLGGGIVKGSLVLISGEPGIGKSTIIMQTANNIANRGKKVLYVSGEESEMQLKMRADRICGGISENIFVMVETNMEVIYESVKTVQADFLIIDSIQTIYSAQIEAAPGSVSQVRMCGNELMRIGKSLGVPIFIVAHVTKSGELAGPKIVEHLVDCVLHFSGERNHELRILRSYKNRFGTTSEIGAFEMMQEGLSEIDNLSNLFIDSGDNQKEGSVITAIYEGTRPLLLEIQALTASANVGFARRTGIGVDNSRLNMMIAILERKIGVSLSNQDIYVNVVGGLKSEGTYIDLSVALAIYSSYKNKVCKSDTLVIGEVGLAGEIRNIQNCDKILKEAFRMGYKRVIIPKGNGDKLDKNLKTKFEVHSVISLKEAIFKYFS